MISASEARTSAQNICNSKDVGQAISDINGQIQKHARLGHMSTDISRVIKTLVSSYQKEAVAKILRDNGYQVKVDSGHDPRDHTSWENWSVSWKEG